MLEKPSIFSKCPQGNVPLNFFLTIKEENVKDSRETGNTTKFKYESDETNASAEANYLTQLAINLSLITKKLKTNENQIEYINFYSR